MKMEEYERRLRKQLKKETSEIDLDATWNALNAKLELELPSKQTSRASGYLFSGLIIICLSLGYCLSGSSLLKHEKSNISELGTVPIGVESHFAAGPSLLVEMPSSSFAQQEKGKAYAANVDHHIENDSKGAHGSKASHHKDILSYLEPVLRAATEQSWANMTIEDKSQISARHDIIRSALPTITLRPLKHTILLSHSPQLGPISASGIKVNKKKSVGMATYLGIPFGSYKAGNSELAALAHAYNSSLYYLESYGLKLTGNLAISPSFGIRAGLEYNRINQLLETEMTRDIQRTVTNAVVAIKINTVTNDTTFIRGDVVESGTVFQSIRHYNHTSTIRIPIQFEYKKTSGTWTYGLSAGAALTILQRSRGRFIQDNGVISRPLKKREKGWHSLIFEPILEKELNENFILEMRPYLLAPLQQDPNVELLTHKAFQVGIGLGFQYRWH